MDGADFSQTCSSRSRKSSPHRNMTISRSATGSPISKHSSFGGHVSSPIKNVNQYNMADPDRPAADVAAPGAALLHIMGNHDVNIRGAPLIGEQSMHQHHLHGAPGSGLPLGHHVHHHHNPFYPYGLQQQHLDPIGFPQPVGFGQREHSQQQPAQAQIPKASTELPSSALHPLAAQFGVTDGSSVVESEFSKLGKGKPSSGRNSKAIDLADENAFPTLGASSSPVPSASNRSGSSLFSSYATAGPSAASSQAKKNGRGATVNDGQASVDIALDQFLPELAPRTQPPPGPLLKALKNIQDKTKTKLTISRRNNFVTVTARGAKQDVCEQALRMAAAAICTRTSATLSLPTSLRGLIVGTKGTTIQSIQSRTQTRIDFPRNTAALNGAAEQSEEASRDEGDTSNDESTAAAEDDDYLDRKDENESMIDVTISGDAQGVVLAKAEIQQLVGHRMGKATARIPNTRILPSLYTFLQGAHGSKAAEYEAKHQVKLHFPPPGSKGSESEATSGEETAANKSAASNHIAIVGETDSVRACVKELLRDVDQLRRSAGSMGIDIPKRQHRHIIGIKGAHLTQLMSETGCIVEMPAAQDPSAKITIRGPSDQLMAAFTFVMHKANSVATDELDLLQHARDEKAANVLFRYLLTKARSIVRQIEENHNVQIFFPRSDSSLQAVLEISGKIKESVAEAREALIAQLQDKGTAHTATLEVPSELHRHSKVRAALNRTRDELKKRSPAPTLDTLTLLEGPIEVGDELILIYFDAEAKKANKKSSTSTKATLERIAEDIQKAAALAADFQSQKITIPKKYHGHLIGPKGATLQKIIAECSHNEELPVSVIIGSKQKPEDGQGAHLQVKLDTEDVLVRGVSSEVEEVITRLCGIVDQVKHVDVMGSYVEDVSIPAKFVAQIIGRNGANISKYKEVIGIVKIDIGEAASGKPNVSVHIQGTKEAVQEVKKQMRDRVAQLEDSITSTIKIPSQFHGKIIGEGGKYVRRLEEKYSVRIKFPRGSKQEKAENTGARENPDVISIEGSKKGVASAAAELTDLYQYEKDISYTEQLKIPKSAVASLVGKQGSRINQLKQLTDTKIDVDASRSRQRREEKVDADGGQEENEEQLTQDPEEDTDGSTSDEPVTVTFVGTREQVQLARQVVRHLVSILDNMGFSWKKTIVQVPAAVHRRLIGSGGSSLREFLQPFKKENAAEVGHSKKSSAGSVSDEVKALVRAVFSVDATTSGNAQLSADLRFPKTGDSVEVRAVDDETLEAVVQSLKKQVAAFEEETTLCLHIPIVHFRALIGRGGSAAQELEQLHSCNINFEKSVKKADEPEPVPEDRLDLKEEPLGTVQVRGAEDNVRACISDIFQRIPVSQAVTIPGAVLRRLMGGAGASLRRLREKHDVQIDLPDRRGKSNGPSDEVWHVRGAPEKVESAVAELKEAIEREEQPQKPSAANSGIVLEISDIEPSMFRHVIGQKAITISHIRMATNTRIDVPKGGKTITVRGKTQEEVDEAERMIREAASRGSS